MAQITQSPSESKVFFEIVFRPSVGLTTVVRRFITDFYATVVGGDEPAPRLALATHELLENASADLGLARLRCEGAMDMDLNVEGDRVHISAFARTGSEATP